MSTWTDLGCTAPDDFSNPLRAPPERACAARSTWPGRTRLAVALLLLTAVPRAWMAWRWQVVWPDTVTYFSAAEALERGDPAPMLFEFGPNLYPPLLAILRRTGLDWEVAGKLWSTALASLAVLPLFGWLRRQFDDRVALVGGVLYALHPRLMVDSPLVIRDPTFWFLFLLTLYLGYRAAIEVRLCLFLATGVALVLAIYTRTEGWLLAIPLVLWSAMRWRAAAGLRLRLVASTVLCLAVVPAAVVLANATWFKGQPCWVVPGGHYMLRLQAVKAAESGAEGNAAAVIARPPGLAPSPALGPAVASRWHAARKMALRMAKSFTYAYGLLLLVGMWHWRRTLLNGDQLAIALMNVLLWGLIWFRYSKGMGIDYRYFFPSICTGLGYMALGLLHVVRGLAHISRGRIAWGSHRRSALVLGLLMCLLAAGVRDRAVGAKFMDQHADLGRWICASYGPNRRVVGCMPEMRMVFYYARTTYEPGDDCQRPAGEQLRALIEGRKPDVVLLWDLDKDLTQMAAWKAMLAQHPELNVSPVPPERLPASCRTATELLVLVPSGR